MSEKIKIYPSRLKHFGPSKDAVFAFVTNPEFVPNVEIERDAEYDDYVIIPYDGKVKFPQFLQTEIPDSSHVLIVSPNALIESPTDEELGARRKLSIMACNSAPTPWGAVTHFLRAAEQIDPHEQEQISESFFETGLASEKLMLVDPEYDASLTFDHLNDNYNWFEQLGELDWQGQQVFPSGEISCFLVPLYIPELDPEYTFDLNGTIAFKGYPILHSGPPSFLLEDQARIHAALATMEHHAVRAHVENGIVTRVEASHPDCEPAARMLNTMFEVDSRYRQVFEIGFSLNKKVELYPGNTAMNEVYGGRNGHIHFGLGMLPHTQYHLDIICTGTRLLGKENKLMLGDPLSA